jgi:hypothetical protein
MKRLVVLALAVSALACAAAATSNPSRSITLTTRGPVVALAADGDRAALVISGRGRWQILGWEPRRKRTIPIHTVVNGDCGVVCGPRGSLALAGTRVAWDEASGGNSLETTVSSATFARRRALSLAAGSWDVSVDGSGDEALGPAGDRKLWRSRIRSTVPTQSRKGSHRARPAERPVTSSPRRSGDRRGRDAVPRTGITPPLGTASESRARTESSRCSRSTRAESSRGPITASGC